MSTFAIVILVLLGLYVVLGSIRKKKLLINKFVVILAIVAVGLLMLSGNSQRAEKAVTPQYQQNIPSVQAAPYYLPTRTRAYYVATFSDNPIQLVLTNFYYYDRKKWANSDIPLYFDRAVPEFQNLKIYRRDITGG